MKTPTRITRKNVPYILGDILNGGDSTLKGKALNIEIIAPMKQNISRYITSNRGFERCERKSLASMAYEISLDMKKFERGSVIAETTITPSSSAASTPSANRHEPVPPTIQAGSIWPRSDPRAFPAAYIPIAGVTAWGSNSSPMYAITMAETPANKTP
ncbi:Uncharacterised protein [Mycobacteroides abscessus subsp. massiliense]|nr:Uncharacterised protein [Mycobacteroides abscessus subsp. massiliense]